MDYTFKAIFSLDNGLVKIKVCLCIAYWSIILVCMNLNLSLNVFDLNLDSKMKNEIKKENRKK